MVLKTVIRSICHGLIIIRKSQTTPVLIENIFLKLRYSWIYSFCAYHSENPYLRITSFTGQIYFKFHFKLKWDRILWCILTLSFVLQVMTGWFVALILKCGDVPCCYRSNETTLEEMLCGTNLRFYTKKIEFSPYFAILLYKKNYASLSWEQRWHNGESASLLLVIS